MIRYRVANSVPHSDRTNYNHTDGILSGNNNSPPLNNSFTSSTSIPTSNSNTVSNALPDDPEHIDATIYELCTNLRQMAETNEIKENLLTLFLNTLYIRLDVASTVSDQHEQQEEKPQNEQQSTSTSISSNTETSRATSKPSSLTLAQHLSSQSHPQPHFHSDDDTECPDEVDKLSIDRTFLPDLACSICSLVLYRPITTICGHSFCQSCFQSYMQSDRERIQSVLDVDEDVNESTVTVCPYPHCGYILEENATFAVCVMLTSTLEKCFSNEYRIAALHEDAIKLMQEKQYEQALNVWNLILPHWPWSFYVHSQRILCHIYSHQYEIVLQLLPLIAHLVSPAVLYSLFPDTPFSMTNSSQISRTPMSVSGHGSSYTHSSQPISPGYRPSVNSMSRPSSKQSSQRISMLHSRDVPPLPNVVPWSPHSATLYHYYRMLNLIVNEGHNCMQQKQYKNAIYCFAFVLQLSSPHSVDIDRDQIAQHLLQAYMMLFAVPRPTAFDIIEEKEVVNRESTPAPTRSEIGELLKRIAGEDKKDSTSLFPTTFPLRPHLDIPSPSLIASELNCFLCMSVMFEPVTTMCGHTFCRMCLARALDHNNFCPFCRSSLSVHINPNRQACNITMREILTRWCPKLYEQRKLAIVAELEEQSVFIPIFVCTIVMPGMPCPLHIFEPRYRLMIRVVMDSGHARFGMCLPTDRNGNFSQVGTTCDIQRVRLLPDGRSLVETIGGRRFHVLERSVRNGYNVARVEWFDDLPENEQAAMFRHADPPLDQLINIVKDRTNTRLIPRLTHMWSTLTKQFGPMPSLEDSEFDPTKFAYWLGALLPMDIEQKYQFLQVRTQYERYKILLQILQAFEGGATH